ncbi:type II toxin-antitoxin system RelE/ParE family toxin [Candidatus Roizmanbacteria bacterium]|nr:type II toxin-antitoxin system RelE/ParE family toxin [Candidatus Roizmanbacteria bacterium]
MKWEILEYETNRGERPVAEFIKAQQPHVIAKIAHLIDLLEIHGNFLSLPHSKRLESNLYELRVRGKGEIRIIYAFLDKKIYLLSGFKKQKQKTPKKEIETARARLLSLT